MKKLCILLIFSDLVVKIKTTKITAMHNLFANFVKILEVCKYLAKDLVNDKGNILRPGVVPRFSDLEVITLSLTAESYMLFVEFQELSTPTTRPRRVCMTLIIRTMYSKIISTALSSETEDISMWSCNSTCSKRHTSAWRCRIDATRKIGNLSTSLSARRERESKRFFRNCNSPTNSTSCGITQRIGWASSQESSVR